MVCLIYKLILTAHVVLTLNISSRDFPTSYNIIGSKYFLSINVIAAGKYYIWYVCKIFIKYKCMVWYLNKIIWNVVTPIFTEGVWVKILWLHSIFVYVIFHSVYLLLVQSWFSYILILCIPLQSLFFKSQRPNPKDTATVPLLWLHVLCGIY